MKFGLKCSLNHVSLKFFFKLVHCDLCTLNYANEHIARYLPAVDVIVRLSHFHLLLNRCTDSFQILCGVTPVDIYQVCSNLGTTPIFQGIMSNFLSEFQPVLKRFSLKPLARKHSYLVCKVSRGSRHWFVKIESP